MNEAENRAFERQSNVRFANLQELFFARVLLCQVDHPLENRTFCVEFDISTLIPTLTREALRSMDEEQCNCTATLNEEVADVLNSILNTSFRPASNRMSILQHCNYVIRKALNYLRDGDDFMLNSMIEECDEPEPGQFKITLESSRMRAEFPAALFKYLEIPETLLSSLKVVDIPIPPRIDFRKEADLLKTYITNRIHATGEREFEITSGEIPFRHALSTDHRAVALPSPGTCGPSERVLMPMVLECAGFLDITSVTVYGHPIDPNAVQIKYGIRCPAKNVLFGTIASGLTPEMRRSLSEIQLSIFSRIHADLMGKYVFLERPDLESQFAEIFTWILRKITYCLEDPCFVAKPAQMWLANHLNDENTRMEVEFFDPFIHERLRESFANRVVPKPKMFGGEIDYLFGDIPLELKVRRGQEIALADIIDKDYRPASQAAAYASHSRVGIVMVLDLPDSNSALSNLDSCFHVFERKTDSMWPTCVVVAIFHCQNTKPSAIR